MLKMHNGERRSKIYGDAMYKELLRSFRKKVQADVI